MGACRFCFTMLCITSGLEEEMMLDFLEFTHSHTVGPRITGMLGRMGLPGKSGSNTVGFPYRGSGKSSSDYIISARWRVFVKALRHTTFE